jgi:hypothetical protein
MAEIAPSAEHPLEDGSRGRKPARQRAGYPVGKRLRYKRYAEDFRRPTNIWDDTVISGFGAAKLYAVRRPRLLSDAF